MTLSLYRKWREVTLALLDEADSPNPTTQLDFLFIVIKNSPYFLFMMEPRVSTSTALSRPLQILVGKDQRNSLSKDMSIYSISTYRVIL